MAEFKAALRKKLSREGEALPDGSFPIRNEKDLKKPSNNQFVAKAVRKKVMN